MGTPGSSDQEANEDGLANNHAYTVIGVTTLSNEQRLVKLRNPWGSEDYHGAWSDDSENWTEALKEEVDLEQTKSDGIFFMSIEDYHEQVEETYFNKEVSTWHSAHFLMLDDNTQADNPGDDTWWCGTDCTQHKVTVKSDADQGVYITAHTWDDRCMADVCETWNVEKYHGMMLSGTWNTGLFKYGAYQEFVEMTAGQEIEVTVTLNFVSEEMAHDWSVVAYAPTGSVHVTHNKGYESSTLPLIEGSDTTDDATDHTNDETDETNDGEEQADGEEEEADPDADGEGEEENADGEGEEEDADGEGEQEDADGEGEEEDADGEGEEEEEDADGEEDDEEQEES